MAAPATTLRGPTAEQGTDGTVDLLIHDRSLLSAIEVFAQGGGFLPPLLHVSVVHQDHHGSEPLPPVSGRYLVTDAGLRFTPHFPFEDGVSYRAVADLRPFRGPNATRTLVLEYGFSAPEEGDPAVERIYPSSTVLPANLLRFHVYFSHAMRRGVAGTQVSLLGPDGEEVSDALYRAPLELWDREMRCLTVLLDPGRLKRGVGPNRALGPPLQTGLSYLLMIGQGMACSSGRNLLTSVSKRFTVAAPVLQPIAAGWSVVPPAAGSHDPLLLRVTRPLDWASVHGAVTVARRDGQVIGGCVLPAENEMGLVFIPAKPWNATLHELSIDPHIEDVCGNRVNVAFERALGEGLQPSLGTPQPLLFHPS